MKNEKFVQHTLEWWTSLQEDHRGDRAELQRCHNLDEVAFAVGYHRLLRGPVKPSLTGQPLQALAWTLAYVKSDVRTPFASQSVASQFAGNFAHEGKLSAKDAAPKLKPIRFRRLVVSTTWDDFAPQMVRIVRLLDGALSVEKLADDLPQFINPFDQRVAQKWARDYYEQVLVQSS